MFCMHKKLMIISRLVIMAIILLLFNSCAKTFDTTYNNVALKIDSIVPANGSAGTPVRIYGTGFALNTTDNKINFNGTPASIDKTNTNTIGVLLVYAPANGKTGNVAIIKGTDSATGPVFTYNILAPHIQSISPATGFPFITVTITGNNFSATATNNNVLFNNIKAVVLTADTNRLQVQVPLPPAFPPASIPVTITFNGLTSNGVRFQYLNYAPVISSINPTSGIAGTQVTINGSNFLSDTSKMTVSFNGVKAVFVSATATKLVVKAPNSTTGKISVTIIPYNVAATGPVFTYLLPPIINSISPTSGQAGATVTITGSNFVADTSKNIVYFNGVKAAVITSTTSQIVVLAPISTTGKVSVTANGLTGTGPVFTYVAHAPVITNIAYNNLFIIYGQHFDPTASVVSIDGHIASGFTYADYGNGQSVLSKQNYTPPATTNNPAPVTVTVNNVVSNSYSFLFSPQINSVTPDTVSYRNIISLTGILFGNRSVASSVKAFYYDQGQNKIYMSPDPTVVSWNTNTIKINMPDYGSYPIGTGAQPFYLEVNVGGKTTNASVHFHIL